MPVNPRSDADNAPPDEVLANDQPSAQPDQDGPHDVPDDQVIDKTLPKQPIDDGGRPS